MRVFVLVYEKGNSFKFGRTLPQMNVKLENEAALMVKLIIIQMKFNKGIPKSSRASERFSNYCFLL